MIKYISILLLIGSQAYGQSRAPKGFIYLQATSDNYSKVMSYQNPTFAELDTLIQLGRNYTQISRDTALLIIDRTIDLCKNKEELDWQNNYAKALSSKGAALENDEGIKCLMMARSVFAAANNKNGMASTDRIRGSIYQNKGQLKESIEAFLSSIRLYEETKADPRALLNPLQGVSDIYYSLGEYEKAKTYMQDAIMIADTTDSFHREAYLRRRQAIQLFRIGEEMEARSDTTFGDELILLRSDIKHYQASALVEAEQAIAAAAALEDMSEVVECKLVKGTLLNKLGKFEKALSIADEMLPQAKSIGFPLFLVRTELLRATSLSGLKRYNKALTIAERILEESKKEKYNTELGEIYNLITRLYIRTKNQDRAIEILKERNLFEEEQNSLATKNAVAEAETKYQTAEKEKQILSQEKDILQLASKNEKIRKRYFNILGGTVLLGLFAFFGIRYRTIKKDRNDKKVFTENLIKGQEDERKRIASDLHDGIGQSLLLIKKQLMKSDKVTDDSRQLISTTLEEVRSISRGLHPFQLEKFGLTATIKNILDNIKKSTELFISEEIENIDDKINERDQIHIFRTIQEVLNNTIKHAEATAIKVEVSTHNGYTNITIQDNGVGFDLQNVQKTSKSLGIRTMHQRISAIGGELEFVRGVPKGTTVRIRV